MKALKKMWIILVTLLAALSANAATKAIIITLSDGTQKTTQLTDVARLTLNNGNVTVVTTTGTNEATPISSVSRITFGLNSGITNAATDGKGVKIYPSPCDSYIAIEGLNGMQDVELYNAQGQLIKEAALEGSGVIDMNAMSQGLYLVKTGNVAYKIVKR